MRAYLLFQLYGPLASWGDIAVGEVRPTALAPTKSAVVGLIAAALGIRRPDTARSVGDAESWEAAHEALAKGYGFAVMVQLLGVPLVDYHTAQVPSSGSGKNRRVFATRRDELDAEHRSALNTILSRRGYRQDSFCSVALWGRDGAPCQLEKLREALLEPEFTLYLGRKSCPPALPLAPVICRAATMEAAIGQLGVPACFEGFQRLREGSRLLLWDLDAETEIREWEEVERRDQAISRSRWQFAVRHVGRAVLPADGER